MPLVTRSILEVVIPEHAVPKLITKSRNMLSQISKVNMLSTFIYFHTSFSENLPAVGDLELRLNFSWETVVECKCDPSRG